MRTLIMATNNEHKLREVRQILGEQFIVKGLSDIGCHEDIPETGDTFESNAREKARYVHEHYGVDCFADDSGLEVDALGGAPGVHTARYAGQDHNTEANTDKLLRELKENFNRHARFRTVIALIIEKEVHFFDGVVVGEISTERRGTDGFGYDPVFIPEDTGKTFAELGVAVKNQISHRARAVKKLVAYLLEI